MEWKVVGIYKLLTLLVQQHCRRQRHLFLPAYFEQRIYYMNNIAAYIEWYLIGRMLNVIVRFLF